jgi:uncharacterized membrane protein YciS (DUF1049 family)
MKDILIGLLVVMLVLLTLGAVNHDVRIDLDYLFGTWHQVSLLWLSLIAVGLVGAAGVLAAGYVGVRAGGDRHKLEQELEQTYARLRAAEAQARPAQGEAAVSAPAAAETSVSAPAVEAETIAMPPADAETATELPPAEADTGAGLPPGERETNAEPPAEET